MNEAELETYRLHRRFDRMGRLIGDEKMRRLMNAHVMVIGLGGAMALAGVIRAQLFGVEPTDPVTLGAVSVGLLLIALLACYLPARRALRINPAAVLRAD